MTRILFLNGPPRSGKDTAARILYRERPFRHYKFAEPLKRAAHSILGLGNIRPEAYDLVKDLDNFDFFHKKPRDVYISLSEEWAKRYFGTDFFGKVALRRIERDRASLVVFSDCGFYEEILPLISYYPSGCCFLLHLERPGTSFKGDSRSWIEPPPGLPYGRLINDGSLEDLRRNLLDIVDSWMQNA